MLAECYNTDEKIIQQNFTRNESRFVEGKHYIKLQGAELKEFKTNLLNEEPSLLRVNCLYLWTKQGAARHAKMLTTDEAWAVYEELEENYFTQKQLQIPSYQIEDPIARAEAWIVEQREKLAIQVQRDTAIEENKVLLLENTQLQKEITHYTENKQAINEYTAMQVAAKVGLFSDTERPRPHGKMIAAMYRDLGCPSGCCREIIKEQDTGKVTHTIVYSEAFVVKAREVVKQLDQSGAVVIDNTKYNYIRNTFM